MAKGTLIAAMNIGQAAEDEFHDWYDTEHLPERQRVPGFLVCERWIGVDDRKVSVATYDLETVGVLKTQPYLAIGGENLSPWSSASPPASIGCCRLGLSVLPSISPPTAPAAFVEREKIPPISR